MLLSVCEFWKASAVVMFSGQRDKGVLIESAVEDSGTFELSMFDEIDARETRHIIHDRTRD
jgi:hypothetical protein